jgi:uncharacterized protein (TIGR02453 family)
MLQKATLRFLQNIKENNNKAWLDANRSAFDAAKENFEQVVTKVIDEFGKKEDEIAMLKAKECIFRQNRDVRFSKDKSPYKIHMGASIDRGGKKSGFAGYYFHCEPGDKSFVGGGLWMPEAPALKKVRQEIDYCWDEFQKIVTDKKFVVQFGDLDIEEFTLSREPKGYEKDNPAIKYLKLKSFVALRSLNDEELMSKDLVKKITTAFEALKPLIRFINRSIED